MPVEINYILSLSNMNCQEVGKGGVLTVAGVQLDCLQSASSYPSWCRSKDVPTAVCVGGCIYSRDQRGGDGAKGKVL